MKPKDPHFNLKVTISAVALAMIGMHFIWPRLTLDAIGLGLVVVGLAPWMAPLVKAIKLPGGLELELQELRDKTNDARGAAASARQRADIALSQTNLASPESVTVASANLTSTSPEEAFGKLADEYARLRHDFWSGAERTQKMTGVVGRIVELSKKTNWNTSQYLTHKDRAWRLIAYAGIFGRPEYGVVEGLVQSAYNYRDDNKPFGQYWSILAIQRVLGCRKEGEPVPKDIRNILINFYGLFEPGTDRHDEMRRVIEPLMKDPFQG